MVKTFGSLLWSSCTCSDIFTGCKKQRKQYDDWWWSRWRCLRCSHTEKSWHI